MLSLQQLRIEGQEQNWWVAEVLQSRFYQSKGRIQVNSRQAVSRSKHDQKATGRQPEIKRTCRVQNHYTGRHQIQETRLQKRQSKNVGDYCRPGYSVRLMRKWAGRILKQVEDYWEKGEELKADNQLTGWRRNDGPKGHSTGLMKINTWCISQTEQYPPPHLLTLLCLGDCGCYRCIGVADAIAGARPRSSYEVGVIAA